MTKARAKEKQPTFAEVGRRAAIAAQREYLRTKLNEHNWNLSAVARDAGLVNASNVVRAIVRVGLKNEYDKARERGDVAPGRPAE